jgi:hypothetical protein
MSPSRTAVQGAAVVSTAPPAWRPGYQRGPPLARHEAPSPPASPTSSSILTASWLGGQRPRSARKERCHVRGEQLGSLECREVSAAWHLGPALNVEHLFGEGARRMTDLARERRVGGGCAGTCERNGPWLVAHRVVGPERRVDRAGDPVQRDVCEEPVDIDRRLEVAVSRGDTPPPAPTDQPAHEATVARVLAESPERPRSSSAGLDRAQRHAYRRGTRRPGARGRSWGCGSCEAANARGRPARALWPDRPCG